MVNSDLHGIRVSTQFCALDPEVFIGNIATVSDAYNLQFSFALSDRIVIGDWGGLNPDNNADNGDLVLGTLRTTFIQMTMISRYDIIKQRLEILE